MDDLHTHTHAQTFKACATVVPDVVPSGRKPDTHLAYTHRHINKPRSVASDKYRGLMNELVSC